MKVTYFVSTYNNPKALRCCLASIQCQTDPDFEVRILDNSSDMDLSKETSQVIRSFQDPRFIHHGSRMDDCYLSVNAYRTMALGDFLCFPSDDGYMVPMFQETMLQAQLFADFIFCDVLYDPRFKGRYAVMDAQPLPGAIDKTCFMVRRDKFDGFVPDPDAPFGTPCKSDGYTAQALAKKLMTAKAPGVLVVHN